MKASVVMIRLVWVSIHNVSVDVWPSGGKG
jgi:hypothetical protein